MNKKVIIANWKMNPSSFKEGISLFQKSLSYIKNIKKSNVIICPPYIYLDNFNKVNNKTILGSQNVSVQKEGAYTGEISALMLKNFNIKYCIVGHSERRQLGESNEDINKKIKLLLGTNIVPILCIGENKRDEDHKYLNFIKKQIVECLYGISKEDFSKIIIAYEPIWAIGKLAKRGANLSEFLEIKIFIKKVLNDSFKIKDLNEIKIIYGGSVNKKIILSFLKEDDIDGFLIGRASLDTDKFKDILEAIENFN